MKYLWLVIFWGVLVWSAIDPKDQLTWLLEVSPAIIGFVVLVATYRSFHLTSLAYGLILIHCIILMVGGHYTYAEVPAFEELGAFFGSERNNYDKVGHLAQGFVPAVIAREILIRLRVVNGRGWLLLYIVCFCLAFSAFYELIEWWVALAIGQDAESFLGTQGYEWDTQSDMALALLGSVLAVVTLSGWHDRQLSAIERNSLPSSGEME